MGIGKSLRRIGRSFEHHVIRPVAHGVHHIGHQVEQEVRKPMKVALPIFGGVVGGIVGGPAGAAVGGGLGRALTNQHHGSFGKNFLQGAGMGTLAGVGLPALGQATGVSAGSGLGTALGMGGKSAHTLSGLLGSLGFGSAMGAGSTGAGLMGGPAAGATFPHVGGMTPWLGGGAGAAGASSGMGGLGTAGSIMGGLGAMGGRGQAHSPYGVPQENAGFWENLGSQLTQNPLQSLLMGTTIAGGLFGRRRQRGHGQPESVEEIMKREGFGRQSKPIRARGAERKTRQRNKESGTDWQFFEDVNPELRYEEYKKGGHVETSTYIRGKSSGIADNYKTELKPNDFIINATVTSLMGDGNSDAGEKVWKDFERKYLESGFVRASDGGDLKIPAKLSHGEIRVPRNIVAAIGGGSIKVGVKKLNNLQKNILKHKGVKSILPPKTKPLERYMA